MTKSRELELAAQRLAAVRRNPVEFCRQFLCLQPHEGQRRWLNGAGERQNILVTGNRWGKSEITAAKKIFECVFRVGWSAEQITTYDRRKQTYNAINVAPTADQARIVFNKAIGMLQQDAASWLVSRTVESPFPKITFINGAVLEARTTDKNGAKLEGNNYDRLSWDECALEKNFLAIRDGTLRMRLLDRRGRMDLVSTGKGRNDFGKLFLRALSGQEPGTYAQHGRTWENTFLPADEIAALKALLGSKIGAQNIEGEIIDSDLGFFSVVDIDEAQNDILTSQTRYDYDDGGLVKEARVHYGYEAEVSEGIPWVLQFPDHRYVHFWDLADKKDWCVGITLDTSADQMKLVEFSRFNQMGWAYNYDRIRERHMRYRLGRVGEEAHTKSQTYVDATGVGDVAIDALRDIDAEGLVFSRTSKDDALTSVQSALSLRQLEMPMINVLYDELRYYERDDKKIVQDCVMSLAGAVYFGRRQAPPTAIFGF